MSDNPIILFDGICNFCNASVNFIIRNDMDNIFRFATLQSQVGQQLMKTFHLPGELLASFILIEKGKAYKKSTAALRLLNHLPWYWKIFKVFWIVPKFLRDFIYDFIAKNRYAWFGKKDECMVPTPELKNRFLS